MGLGWNRSDFSVSDDATKVSQHLSLLRSEYVKLQQKHLELQKRHALCNAGNGDGAEDQEETFPKRIMETIASLHNKETYR